MLEPPRQGVSNKYPQSMFWIKNKKNKYTPANPSFTIQVGFMGVFIAWTCFPDAKEWLTGTVSSIPIHMIKRYRVLKTFKHKISVDDLDCKVT